MPDYQFVTERLAIGGAIRTVENLREIVQAGITHIVDMQEEFDDRSLANGIGVEVLWIPCADDFLPKVSEIFWDGVLFALEALQDRQARVLFHCAAGIHRGPMMLLAVLRVLGHEPEQAKEIIVSARPQAEFPEVYLESIEEFVTEYHAAISSKPPAERKSE